MLATMSGSGRIQPMTAAALLALAMLASITSAMAVGGPEGCNHRMACVSGLVASSERSAVARARPVDIAAGLPCGTLPGAPSGVTPAVSVPAAWSRLDLPPPSR